MGVQAGAVPAGRARHNLVARRESNSVIAEPLAAWPDNLPFPGWEFP